MKELTDELDQNKETLGQLQKEVDDKQKEAEEQLSHLRE